MQHDSNENRPSTDGEDPLLHRLKKRIKSSPPGVGQSKRLKVDVNRRGRWFILTGSVSSYQLKLKLFSWVPRINGGQHIVDRLRVRHTCGVEG